jgi:adenosylcobyric acid synthase
MTSTGLADAVRAAASSKVRVLGVCGGCMLLGSTIADPHRVEGATTGLGLLPMETELAPRKLTRKLTVSFPDMPEPWTALSGLRAEGYEIRNGRVADAACNIAPLLWMRGSVLATTVHGLLEDPDVLHALFGTRPAAGLEQTFDLLADAVDQHLDTALLRRLVDA